MLSSHRRAKWHFETIVRNLSAKPPKYGQPSSFSHPHLVKPNETTPGIPSSDYEQRRRRLMDVLPDKSLVVMIAAPVKYMSGNIFYKYRQSSDFWYLTGFEEPNSAVILEKNSSQRGYRMTLFSSVANMTQEKWDGASTSHSSVKEIFHADGALPLSTFSSHLKSLLPRFTNIYVDPPIQTSRRKATWFNYLTKSLLLDKDGLTDVLANSNNKPIAPHLGKLRSIKSPAEQAAMRAAADISARSHTKTMRFARPGRSESALAAHFEYLCALSGARQPAYVPVVASGANSLVLHYTRNDQIIDEGELILIDAGCEHHGYASDITRTFPASGTFSPPQRDLYCAVLATQKQVILLCSEDAGYSQQELHQKSCEFLKTELNQIGFNLSSEGDLERVLFPHYLSHHIGIDLHESAHTDRAAPLKAGMVITIEPGVYVPAVANFPKFFHNLGIRIEDEVLVGNQHPTILSVSAPKEVADVEGTCQGLLESDPLPDKIT